MGAVHDVRGMLEGLDPAPPGGELPDDEQRERQLVHILASAPGRAKLARTVPRRRVLLAGGLAIVAAAAAALAIDIGQPPDAAYAATPPALQYQPPATSLSASQRLRQLASVAAAAPSPVRAPGTVEHLRSTNWFLNSAISGRQAISAVVPEEWQSWRSDDDSGRLIKHALPPVFRSETDRAEWLKKGGSVDSREDVTNFPAGQFHPGWQGSVPTDETSLLRWLVKNRSEHEAHVQYLQDVAELAGVRLLNPAQRAAALRLLADLPGMTVTGTVVDRAGRAGEAFSMESDFHGLPTRYTIIIDPHTGVFLGYEEMLTTTAGKLNVSIPAVVSYRSYLAAEYAPMPR